MPMQEGLPPVPAFNLATLNAEGEPERLYKAFRDVGAIALKIDEIYPEFEALLNDFENQSWTFWRLSQEEKNKFRHPEANFEIGYNNEEKASHMLVPDNKEMLTFKRAALSNEPYPNELLKNIDLPMLPGFTEKAVRINATMTQINAAVLQVLASQLFLEGGFVKGVNSHIKTAGDLAQQFNRNYSTHTRILHYPENGTAEDHRDRSAFTCLAPRRPGLEIEDRDGNWFAANAKEGWVIINTGRAMGALTNDHILPCNHRVMTEGERLSTVTFSSWEPDTVMEPMISCALFETVEDYSKYRGGTFDDYDKRRVQHNFAGVHGVHVDTLVDAKGRVITPKSP
ncbi:MAG: hypothetical protein GC136_07340 [Alphaproteobacteria bacterium]|nr:hypothetical protein [Alphaproteobacteria bacterium]